MGVVWRAFDGVIGRVVAVKEMRTPEGLSSAEREDLVRRAFREAGAAGRIKHPGVVAIHDVLAPGDGAVYIVMELIEWPTLERVIAYQGALPPEHVARIGLGLLAAAHALQVVHRDVKPGNVMVGPNSAVKLTDFGIAVAASETRLTTAGVVGTHAYLAPEAFDRGPIGPATDLWSLGATLYHAVQRYSPFERETTSATLRAILIDEPPRPSCGGPLAEVIAGLLTRPIEQTHDRA
jgi:serine/threonine protein kinase